MEPAFLAAFSGMKPWENFPHSLGVSQFRRIPNLMAKEIIIITKGYLNKLSIIYHSKHAEAWAQNKTHVDTEAQTIATQRLKRNLMPTCESCWNFIALTTKYCLFYLVPKTRNQPNDPKWTTTTQNNPNQPTPINNPKRPTTTENTDLSRDMLRYNLQTFP